MKQTAKKWAAFLLAMVLTAAVLPLIASTEVAADSYETAWFPAPVMKLTQIAYESYSHGSQNAIDIVPGGNVFAPFTGKITYVDSNWGYVVLQSTNKVYYADGTLDYMSVGFMHDENVSDLYVGRVIPQGTAFYQMGGMGNGNPNAYGDHVHLTVHKGRVTRGYPYGTGDYYAYNAFYINTAKTTSILNRGKMVSGNYMTHGAPSDWSNLWRDLSDSGNRQPQNPYNLGDSFTAWMTNVNAVKNLDYDAKNGNNVVINSDNHSNSQEWEFTRLSDGSYKIINAKSGEALDVHEANGSPATNVKTYTYTGSAAQNWFLYEVGGKFALRPKCSEECFLDVQGGNTGDGTNVQIYTYNGTASQLFTIFPSKIANLGNAFTATVTGVHSGKNLDYDAGNGNAAIIRQNTASNSQFWNFERNKDGSYKICNVESGEALEVTGGGSGGGIKLKTAAYVGTNAQHWYIHDMNNGKYAFRAACSNGCMVEVAGGRADDYTGLQTWMFNGSEALLFTINALPTEKVDLGTNFTAVIKNGNANMNLDVDATKENNVIIKPASSADSQKWNFFRLSDGGYKIQNVANGEVLDVHAADVGAGANIKTYTDTNHVAQKWYIYSLNGNYVLRPACTQTCVMEIYAGGTTAGSNVHTWAYNKTPAQQFAITKVSSSTITPSTTPSSSTTKSTTKSTTQSTAISSSSTSVTASSTNSSTVKPTNSSTTKTGMGTTEKTNPTTAKTTKGTIATSLTYKTTTTTAPTTKQPTVTPNTDPTWTPPTGVTTPDGHHYGNAQFVDAVGHKFVCTDCGKEISEAHVWGDADEKVAASCNTNGLKVYICVGCGAAKSVEIPATGEHAYGEWETVPEENETTEGKRQRICADCGYADIEMIAAVGIPGAQNDTTVWWFVGGGAAAALLVAALIVWLVKKERQRPDQRAVK